MVPKIRIPGMKIVFPTLRDLLCAHGEQAFILDDFSKLGRLRQDAAGTVPVTGVEQNVGWMGDDAGFYAFQADPAEQGKLSARVNLINDSESDYWWSNYNATSSMGAAGSGPDGIKAAPITSPAATSPGATHITYRQLSLAPGQYVFKVKMKAKGYRKVALADGFGGLFCVGFDLLTGTEIYRNGAVTSASIVESTNGYWHLTVVTSVISGRIYPAVSSMSDDGYFGIAGAYSIGDGTAGAYFSEVDFRPLCFAHLPYQEVSGNGTAYDSVGFPHYIKFTGATSYLTPNFDASNTSKLTVWAGLLPEKSGSVGPLFIFPGFGYSSVQLLAPGFSQPLHFASAGLAAADVPAATGVQGLQPICFAGQTDTEAPSIDVLANAATYSSTGFQGGGNYQNAPIKLGEDSGFFFEGRLYALVVRAAGSTPSVVQDVYSRIKHTTRLP